MTITNKIILIGFENATVTTEVKFFIEEDFGSVEIINPIEFIAHGSDSTARHIITITKDLSLRKQVIEKLDQGNYKRFTFIHKSAIITTGATINPGTFIGPHSMVASNSTVEMDCLIAPYCLISHRVILGQGSVMQSMSMIAGSATVGKYCKFNMKSSTIDFVTIGDFVEIGAGSMLTKSVTEKGVYLGNPARRRID